MDDTVDGDLDLTMKKTKPSCSDEETASKPIIESVNSETTPAVNN